MKTQLLYGLGFSLVISSLSAQSPGGISGNLRGWYKANTGLTITSGAVSQWNDQSGLGNNATQGTGARRPVETVAAMNYNSALTFDGTDDYLNIPDLMATGATALSVFAVARQTGVNNDQYGCILIGQTNNVGSGGGYGFAANGPTNAGFGLFVREYFSNNASFNNNLSAPTVMSGIWNGSAANTISYALNGAQVATDAYTPGSVGDNGNSYIGSGIGSGTDYCFYGNIAELAVYNTGVSDANADRIESYFGLKYGITLSINYLNTAGSSVYATSAPYNNNIIGIGRDDNSSLYQKQSRTQDDSVRIFISSLAASNSANTGTFGGSNQYVVAGASSGRIKGITTEKPGSLFSRIEREWKVQNTGFNSTFSFALKLSAGANPTAVTTSDLRLLVDDDGDFTDASVYSTADGLTFSYTNTVITVGGITTTMVPTNSTKFITIGSGSGATTLPVEIRDFDARVCAREICVGWNTAVEHHNHFFSVERADYRGAFTEVGKVLSKAPDGNTREGLNYEFLDVAPLTGVSYYRLRQVDLDGTSKVTTPVVVESADSNFLEVYPSINEGDFVVRCTGNCGRERVLKLFGADGKLVYEDQLEMEQGTFPVNLGGQVSAGVYLCLIEGEGTSQRQRIVIR
jgi:hypothetical protein